MQYLPADKWFIVADLPSNIRRGSFLCSNLANKGILYDKVEWRGTAGLTETHYFYSVSGKEPSLDESSNSLASLPGVSDFNTLSLEEMADFLRGKYQLSSTAEARCIFALLEFYDKHK